ncbi:hypothetical protein BD410DRAFT_843950 [Rickenella mellea]|uniref:Uncharacterized protein n=1 Tax=Rickenella mellea TaxID=50990 RepID=A0A4Y7PPR2_9AGAM|nr:hypothetical protein BD410DRAFT_843950 [Rickenella mellea]
METPSHFTFWFLIISDLLQHLPLSVTVTAFSVLIAQVIVLWSVVIPPNLWAIQAMSRPLPYLRFLVRPNSFPTIQINLVGTHSNASSISEAFYDKARARLKIKASWVPAGITVAALPTDARSPINILFALPGESCFQ